MATDTTYNGWTNYETWCVALWIDNDQGAQEQCQADAKACLQQAIDNDESDPKASAVTDLAASLETLHDELAPEVTGVFADLLTASLWRVNWREIAWHYVDEVPVWSAGWNMPGYMPDNPPSLFLDADDALAYIIESAVESLDGSDEDEGAGRDNLAEEIEAWKADSKGEFGCTVGGYHYFVSIAS